MLPNWEARSGHHAQCETRLWRLAELRADIDRTRRARHRGIRRCPESSPWSRGYNPSRLLGEPLGEPAQLRSRTAKRDASAIEVETS